MVVGQTDYAGTQADVAGPASCGGDEYLGRCNSLPAPAVVLADPGFVESQIIQPFDQLKVTLQGQGGVLTYPVKRGHKGPERHVVSQCNQRNLLHLA